MIPLFLLLLLAGPPSAGGPSVPASLTVTPEGAGAVGGGPGLQGGVQRLFDIRYGSFVTLAFDGLPATPAASAGAAAHVVLELSGGGVKVSTDLTSTRATRSLVSTVPAGT